MYIKIMQLNAQNTSASIGTPILIYHKVNFNSSSITFLKYKIQNLESHWKTFFVPYIINKGIFK